MRILFITETVPYPLDSGGRIKTYYTLQALSALHEIHCHAFIREAHQASAQDALAAVAASVRLHLVPRSLVREAGFAVRSVLSGAPYTVVRHFDEAVFRELQEACRRVPFDAVYCDHLSMLEYGRRLGLPILHDAHNVEYAIVQRFASTAGWGPRRLAAELEWRSVRRYEQRVYGQCALIYAVSAVDAQEIRAMAGPGPRIDVVPIAVDATHARVASPWQNGPQALFVGSLDWPPNRDAVDYLLAHVWPLVLARLPGAQLTVVGRGTTSVTAANVTFTGWVEDVSPYFESARVLAVPIRSGSGLRVKILESLSRGVPVVTTSVGMEGIAARSEHHLLVADNPDAFADALIRALTDDALVRRLSGDGRQLALERYDQTVVSRQQLASLTGVVGTHQRAGDKSKGQG